MNDFIKSKRLYMLAVLPFIVVAIAFLSSIFSTTLMDYVNVRGCINFDFINQWNSFCLSVVRSCLLLCVAYILFLNNERFKLLHQTTTLPSLIFVLLTSGVVVKLGVNNLLISVFVLAIAIDSFLVSINDIKSNKSLFDFGFFVSIAVAIYPKFIFLIVWAVCISFFTGRSTLKDLLALLFGLLAPGLFLLFYYFWTDSLVDGMDIFVDNLYVGKYIYELSIVELGVLGILFLIFFVSLYQVLIKYAVLVIHRKIGLLAFISILFFLTVSLLIIPGNLYDLIYAISLPLSVIYSQFFLSNKKVILGNIMIVMLLVACILCYLL